MQRMKRLEALYKENVKRMRNTLETKLRKAALALEEQRQERRRKFNQYVSSGKINHSKKTFQDH